MRGQALERPFGPVPSSAMLEPLRMEGFLDSATVERILAGIADASGEAAGVYGRESEARVEPNVRSAQRIAVPDGIRALVAGRLAAAREAIADHFGIELAGCEAPQFLRYHEGDHFVAHQDGNTPLLRDDSLRRRVSAVIFLNASSPEPGDGTYGGGALVLHGRYPDLDGRHIVAGTPGTLVAFLSETTHEVTPVTHGCRYSIVAWYRQ
jgi:SM-20-related protein